jgi:hypothetical protein
MEIRETQIYLIQQCGKGEFGIVCPKKFSAKTTYFIAVDMYVNHFF